MRNFSSETKMAHSIREGERAGWVTGKFQRKVERAFSFAQDYFSNFTITSYNKRQHMNTSQILMLIIIPLWSSSKK